MSTHTLLFFAPLAAAVAVGASLQLLHVTREAFLFVSACMLTYSVRDLPGIDHRTFWRRRFALVAVPYLCWTRHLLLPDDRVGSRHGRRRHLAPLVPGGHGVLPALLPAGPARVLRALPPVPDPGAAHRAGTTACCCWPAAPRRWCWSRRMHWGLAPGWMTGYWATREVTSYQFYLIAGMVMALHLDEFHQLVVHARVDHRHRARWPRPRLAEAWYYLSVDHVASWLGSSADPFQPVVIPFNVGAIACIYLIGVALVDRRRSGRTRRAVHSGSDNSYGVYLAQLLFITLLSWLGWRHLNNVAAVAGGQRGYGGDRVRGLRRPHRAPGPDAVVQAAHRTLARALAGAVAARGVDDPAALTPSAVAASGDGAVRRTGSGRSAQRDRRQRGGDGVAHREVARVVRMAVRARAAAPRTSRSARRRGRRWSARSPAPAHVDRAGVAQFEGGADVGHRHAGLGVGRAQDVVQPVDDRRGWPGRRPARRDRAASSPR